MYVAAKGGEAAIAQSQRLTGWRRRGDAEDAENPALTPTQIDQQLGLAVDRVMTESAVHDRALAALAIKQARGDLMEAIFLVRAFRTTLARLGAARPIDTGTMAVRRRISATFKDLPGGQVLGTTFDYSHRLIDFALAAERDGDAPPAPVEAETSAAAAMPRVTDILGAEALIEPADPAPGDPAPGDLTREPPTVPYGRDVVLQALVRGDEGFLVGLAYSTQRGFGRNHPFAGEIRMGEVAVELVPDELDFPVSIADITVTECQTVNQFAEPAGEPPDPAMPGPEAAAGPRFTRGYGLTFGEAERKALAMALVDRALRAEALGEAVGAPAQDAEFVVAHSDSVEASGFLQHLKLPHYVDFQAELDLLRGLRRQSAPADTAKAAGGGS